MELDDFFGNKQNRRRFDHDHSYQGNPFQAHNYRSSYHRGSSNYKWTYFLEVLKINRKLRGLIIFVLIVILAIVIALIAVLLPLIIKLIDYIGQYGLQGVVETITGFLDKLWKGSGS